MQIQPVSKTGGKDQPSDFLIAEEQSDFEASSKPIGSQNAFFFPNQQRA